MTKMTHAGPLRMARPRPQAGIRLACFPHAGGAAAAFTRLAAALPEEIELVALQYPGRLERRAEPAAHEVARLAAEAAPALAPDAASGRPLALLGHSMGALVAFETARLLELSVPVCALFVSAARPPDEDWGEPDLDALDDAEIGERLRLLGGVPEAMLSDRDVLAEILRPLRDDHRALRRYRCAPGTAVKTRITALHAEADPKNSTEQMRGWSRACAGGFALAQLPGGHFALTGESADDAARLLTTLLRDATM